VNGWIAGALLNAPGADGTFGYRLLAVSSCLATDERRSEIGWALVLLLPLKRMICGCSLRLRHHWYAFFNIPAVDGLRAPRLRWAVRWRGATRPRLR